MTLRIWWWTQRALRFALGWLGLLGIFMAAAWIFWKAVL